MSSFVCLLLFVACAALLQGDCEASNSFANRKNINDAQIALGRVTGSDIVTLPTIEVGAGTTIGFPDNCLSKGKLLLGIQVIVSNKFGRSPPVLSAENSDNARSRVRIQCEFSEKIGSGCPGGVVVTSYQFCGPLPEPISAVPAPEA